MDKTIEFIIGYEEADNKLHINLVEVTSRKGYEDEVLIIGYKWIRIWPWTLFNPEKLGAKVNKIKRDLIYNYKKDRKIKTLLHEACIEWEKERYNVRDSATEDFINGVKKDKNKSNKAKVIPFRTDK